MGPALEFQVICLKLENSCRENEDVAFVVWFPFVKNTKSGFAFQKKTLNTTLHCYLLFIQKTSPPPFCCAVSQHGVMKEIQLYHVGTDISAQVLQTQVLLS